MPKIGDAMREQLREWTEALQSDNADAQAVAASALVELGPAAVGLLWPLLKDPRPSVRTAAASILGKIGPAAEPAVPALARLLRDRDADVRQHATTALRSINPGYLSRRKRWRWFRRLLAAACLLALVLLGYAWDLQGRTLGLVRGEKFFQGRPTHFWAKQLASSDSDVAMARLRAGGHDSFSVLVDIATDRKYPASVRERAIELLGRRELGDAVPVLVPLLEDGEQGVREATARALGKFGSGAQSAVPALIPC
jgi:HEAT repeat protein